MGAIIHRQVLKIVMLAPIIVAISQKSLRLTTRTSR